MPTKTRRFIPSSALYGALGLALAIAAIASPANAVTYVQTSDDCTGGCGISSLNTIAVTAGPGNTTDFKLSLASGFGIVNTGASGSGGGFNFGMTSTETLTFTAVTPVAFAANGIEVQGGSPATGATSTASSAAISAPGKFSFAHGFALNELQGSGGSHPFFGTLEFTVNKDLATVLALPRPAAGPPSFSTQLARMGILASSIFR